MIGNQLVENTWSFKPITFEESVIFMIKKCNGQTFAEERAILIDTFHVRCTVVQIMLAFVHICKEFNGKKKKLIINYFHLSYIC